MKAIVNKEDLLAGVARAAGALPQRPTSHQALQNLLLEFRPGDGALRATATDLEVAIILDIPATIQEEGALAVPGKKLLESVREMPSGEMSLIGSERHSLTLKSGKSRLTLLGAARDEYPAIPPVTGEKSFTTEAPVIREAMRKTIIAASRDEARNFLTGAYLTTTDVQGRFVATDGHRLALCDFSLAPAKKGKGEGVAVIVPARIIQEVAANLPAAGEVKVSVSETHVVFVTAIGTYYSRLIAEKFPEYEKIIPKTTDHKIVVDRVDFTDALRRVNPVVNPRTYSVLLSIKADRIILAAETPEFGEAQDEVDASVTGSSMDISFNARYLQDVLKVMEGEELVVELGAKISPAVFSSAKDQGYRYVLMPLRG